jgi:lipoprotein signal peptidase
MTMPKNPLPHPVGHVLLAAAVIGSLSLLLAVGLSLLGHLARLDRVISTLMAQGKNAEFPKTLPEWALWLATVIFAFGLAFSILSVPGTWRRVVLWVTTLVLVAAWAPVLSLAAHSPQVTAPFIAAWWSGVCALVYAANHRMACDESAEKSPSPPLS